MSEESSTGPDATADRDPAPAGAHADGSGAAIEIAAVPDPVAGYAVADATPRLVRTNPAFATTFDTVAAERPLAEWITRADVELVTATAESVQNTLAAGEPLDTELVHHAAGDGTETRVYRLRSTAPVSASLDGYLLFTPVPAATADGIGIDHLASVVSHDLRNPLDVATARLRAARETGAEEHFDHLASAHDRMERIIQDVLTLARGEGVLTLTDDVTVASVASDAWCAVDTAAATLDVADDLPVTRADPDRLQRLFENLYRNAVEHAVPVDATATDTDATADSPGRPTAALEVRVGALSDGFFVADNGPGVAPADRDRVFEAGYTDAETGTGLGLTIVERIATAHGWTVAVTDSTTGGARFEFRGVTTDVG